MAVSRSSRARRRARSSPTVLGYVGLACAASAPVDLPSTVGLERARLRARELRDTAIGALAPLGHRGAALVQLANFIVNRAS